MLCRFDKFLSDEMPTMKQITNKEYEVEKAKGHVLLPDTIRFICEANGYDCLLYTSDHDPCLIENARREPHVSVSR